LRWTFALSIFSVEKATIRPLSYPRDLDGIRAREYLRLAHHNVSGLHDEKNWFLRRCTGLVRLPDVGQPNQ